MTKGYFERTEKDQVRVEEAQAKAQRGGRRTVVVSDGNTVTAPDPEHPELKVSRKLHKPGTILEPEA